MTIYYRPIVQTDPCKPANARLVAGGWTWFCEAERIERGGRHLAHDDEAYLGEFSALANGTSCAPLDIRGTVIEVDTSRFSEALVDELARNVRATIDSQR